MQKDKYLVINIRKYLESKKNKLGEKCLEHIISEFSCDKNPDIERFLINSSIEFTKKQQSVTYLVFSVEDGELLGYFTIAIKPLTVKGDNLSNSVRRKLLRISELNEKSQTYTMSAYLIAQLGKNYKNGANKRITGEELLETVWNKIKEVQYCIGGVVIFLETINDEKLLGFYKNNRFQKFGVRQTLSGRNDSYELVQLLRIL